MHSTGTILTADANRQETAIGDWIMRVRHLILASAFALDLAIVTPALSQSTDFVPNAQIAAEVASAIIRGHIGDRKYRELEQSSELETELDDGVWTCFFYPRDAGKTVSDNNGLSMVRVVAGGNTPILKISRADSKVIAFYYSK